MATTKNSSFESPALKKAISQAVSETSYLLKGSYIKSSSSTVKNIKKITTVKK